MRRYLPRDVLSEIIVIENPSLGNTTGWFKSLRSEYGELSDLVHVVEAASIAQIPMTTGGWFSQQILKLMVSKVITSDRYVVLDAKNHLVFPLARDFLETGDRIRSANRNYRDHTLLGAFEKAARYFEMDWKEHAQAFVPTLTPFAFPTKAVRNLIDYVIEREQKPFPAAFMDLGLAEFLMFGWFICARYGRIGEIYDLSRDDCPVVWKGTAAAGARAVERLIVDAEAKANPFFAVHHWAFAVLDQAARESIAAFWHRRRLFPTVANGMTFLDDQASTNPIAADP